MAPAAVGEARTGASVELERYTGSFRSAAEDEARVVEAVLACIARWGLSKTTADDVAREAGMSRATLYRTFPGGRDVLLEAVLRHEVGRFFHTVGARLEAATDLEDLLVEGLASAAEFVRTHEPLHYLLAHEPERLLPAFAFHRLNGVLAVATAFTAPHLARFLTPDAAEAGAEWVVRLLLSFSFDPSPTLELSDPASVRSFVRRYVLPGLAAPSPQGD